MRLDDDEVDPVKYRLAVVEAAAEAMAEAKISKVEMARRMGTGRSQLDRVLDPAYTAS